MALDFSRLAEVRRLADEILAGHDRLDVLVNNAGLFSPQYRLSADGFELTFAVNHLAPFLLTNLLLDRLKDSAPARIVTVVSEAHRRTGCPRQRRRPNWCLRHRHSGRLWRGGHARPAARAGARLARLHTVSRRGLRRVRVPFDGARRVGRSTVLGGSAVFEAANALLAKIRAAAGARLGCADDSPHTVGQLGGTERPNVLLLPAPVAGGGRG